MTKHRNPAVTGIIGVLMVIFLTVSALYITDLPIYGAAQRYQAEFSESAGLKSGSEVRIAGVKVGAVEDLALEGDRVVVDIRVEDAWIGDQTSASIQIKTLLGQKYLALEPRGTTPLNPRDRIPLERTVAPYDVIVAFGDAAETLGEIDAQKTQEGLRTLSEAFSGTPEHIRNAVDGISRLSQTISSRDSELAALFEQTRDATAIFADRNQEFARLLANAGLLLAELNTRQAAISTLLASSQDLSRELSGLVQDNREQLGPALAQLEGVTGMLLANQESLGRAINLLAPFYRLYANLLGNGRWFDVAVVNLTPPGVPLVPGFRDPIRTAGGN